MNGSTSDYSLYIWLSFIMMGVIFVVHIIQAGLQKRKIHSLIASSRKAIVHNSGSLNAVDQDKSA